MERNQGRVYRGARRNKKSGKWVSEIREPGKNSRIWLGTYATEEMAARAHDVAALALRGKLAHLNFADSEWRLPIPASKDPMDIRRAAAEAAEGFLPVELDENSVMEFEGMGTSAVSEDVTYIDEEAVFGMPGLIADMANGMMLPPPPPPHCDYSRDDVEFGNADVSLWSYSF